MIKQTGDKISFHSGTPEVEKNFFDTEGFQSIRYRDEYVSGQWVTPQGNPAPDNVTVQIGGINFYMPSFDGSSTEEKQTNQFELPHDLAIDLVNAGTLAIEFHTHTLPSDNNSGTALMFMDWCYLPKDASPIPMTSVQVSIPITNNSTHKHHITGVVIPIPAGGFGIGGAILFDIRRTPSTAGDTYGSDLLLLKCALHVPVDCNGSRERYVR